MRYRTYCYLLAATCLPLLIANVGLGQCSLSGGGGTGNCGSGYTIGQPYPVYPVEQVFPAAVGPFVDPVAAQIDLGAGDSGNFGVYVAHPLNDRSVKVRTFSSRQAAEQLREQLGRRYFVVYNDATSQAGYREVRSSAEIDSVVSELESDGRTITRVARVSARIVEDGDTSLEEILGGQGPQGAEATGVAEGTSTPAPAEVTVPEPVDSELKSLVGLWSAVTRLPDGELQNLDLKLDADGWAQLKVPTENGGQTFRLRASVQDGQLKLTNGDQELVLGELTDVDDNQFVVSQNGGQTTFLKR